MQVPLVGGLAFVLAAAMAGCFGPDAREGLRCTSSGDCPPGQDCFPVAGGPEPGVCSSAPPIDGGIADAGAAAFGAPELVELTCAEAPCLSPRDPSLTDDLGQVAFTVQSVNAPGDLDVYLASRPAAGDPWLTAAPAGTIDSLIVEEGSSVAGNGLALYFSRDDQNVVGPPYDDLWLSERLGTTDPFDSAAPVTGVVNTANGDERSAVRTADGTHLVFTRALDIDIGDHDVYLAVDGGGQWDTVERIPGVSMASADERSVALVEGLRSLFVTRNATIVEARWSGDDIASAEVVAVHDELTVAGAILISGLWVAPDGGEIWFGACDQAGCVLYRAVR